MPTGVYKRIKKVGGWKVKDTSKMRHPWSDDRKKMKSKSMMGHFVSQETRNKIGMSNKGKTSWIKGKHWSEEYRKRMSDVRKGKNGSNWKGGKTKIGKILRRGIEWKLWREAVFKRDNWTCQKYGYRGIKGFGKRVLLHPHHIKNFSQYPELRFSIDNGITLSEKAHKEFHKKYGNNNNTIEQLLDFLYKDEDLKNLKELEKKSYGSISRQL